MIDTNQQKKLPWTLALLWIAVISVLAAGCWSFYSGGLCYDLFGSELPEFFESCGPFAPAAYVVFVTIEVIVAPIPGLMLYAPGGLVFGPWLGGTLAVIGNTIGAGISCLLARSLGNRWMSRFFDPGAVNKVQDRLEQRGALLIFFLRLNPITHTDLLP